MPSLSPFPCDARLPPPWKITKPDIQSFSHTQMQADRHGLPMVSWIEGTVECDRGLGIHVEEVGHPEDALSLGLEELDGALEGTLLVGDHRQRIRHGDKVDAPALGELGSNLRTTGKTFCSVHR
jgi:hypothetical protein